MTFPTRRLAIAFCIAVLAPWPAVTAAQSALGWASTVDEVADKLPGIRGERALAIAWLAAFNALNAIEPRYQPYPPAPPAIAPGAPKPSAEAALAAALYTALATDPDADLGALKAKYREAMAGVKNGAEREAGAVLGRQAALLLLAARAPDRLGRVEPAATAAAAGVFVAPASAKTPRSIATAQLAPFGVAAVAAFDPGPPPAVGSDRAVREIAETRALGAEASTVRSGDQTAAALFWNSGDSGDFGAMVKPVLEAKKLDALDTARIEALGAMINVDTRIVNAALKERYVHWRPETAITGPFAADREPGWHSLVPAPPDPQYPSGGGTGAGSLESTLPRLYGMTGAIEWRNGQTRQTRRWPSAAALADELATSRVWAGVHFRSSVEAGRRVGRAVATDILDHQLLPR